MKRHLPSYVYKKGKKGYLYFCRWGQTVRMHHTPGTAEFASEYALLMRGRPAAPKRTVKGLIQQYQTVRWETLAPNTRKSYSRHFAYFVDKMGNIDPKTIRPVHVVEMRNALVDKPTDATRKIGALSSLLAFGVEIGWLDVNPAKGIKGLPGTRARREPWPVEKIAAFRETADPRSLLIFEMLLGTGQRIGDVLAMRWADTDDDGIFVRQQKTGAALYIPFTPGLADVLKAAPRFGATIVSQDNGRPVGYSLAWRDFMATRTKIGAEAWDFHCLRYTAACEIAALPGMTREHVAALTGHRAAAMVDHYAGWAFANARIREAQNARGTKLRGGDDQI